MTKTLQISKKLSWKNKTLEVKSLKIKICGRNKIFSEDDAKGLSLDNILKNLALGKKFYIVRIHYRKGQHLVLYKDFGDALEVLTLCKGLKSSILKTKILQRFGHETGLD